MARGQATVAPGRHEWAREDDGDGVREVNINSTEGMWTGMRNFLRPFRGVHTQSLSQYIALCEFTINHKHVSPAFIAGLVAQHLS